LCWRCQNRTAEWNPTLKNWTNYFCYTQKYGVVDY
jgi:hypothetical protein